MTKNNQHYKSPSSFRDPSGFIFFHNGTLYRQINKPYKDHYDSLMQSGLYAALVAKNLLIKHEETSRVEIRDEDAYKIIKPARLPFISHPYEWSFNQLKDAALLTLQVQKTAMEFGMSLKDCSAYNVQFYNTKPVFIDTLSFEKYTDGKPWVAYRQFCQHFFAPLALMSLRDIRLNRLLQLYIDGIPLDLANSLLPFSSKFRFSILSHISLQAKTQKYFADKKTQTKNIHLSRSQFLALLDSLESGIKSLRWENKNTEWADYYDKTNYSHEGLEHKKKIVLDLLAYSHPKTVWDLGANNGLFSRSASHRGSFTVALDVDPSAVDKNYLESKNSEENNLLPLLLDLCNPSPAIGWGLQERTSLIERGPCDTILALALVHHLAISNNLPFNSIAEFFSKIGRSLIIEFVPKSDSQVQKLLSTREDIFTEYTEEAFEREFGAFFKIERKERVKGSGRVLYLMIKQ